MAVTPDYLQYVLEQLGGLARVTSRRMFGGMGLYCDGVFFGLIDNDTLFFKVDDTNRPDYVARGMAAFRPFKDRPDQSMSYFEVPADALEDRDELAVWARKSLLAAEKKPKQPSSAGRLGKKTKQPSSAGRLGKKTRQSSGAGRLGKNREPANKPDKPTKKPPKKPPRKAARKR